MKQSKRRNHETTAAKVQKLEDFAKGEAEWLQERDDYRIPSAAPMGTDQEAGGASTNMRGDRKYDK